MWITILDADTDDFPHSLFDIVADGGVADGLEECDDVFSSDVFACVDVCGNCR